VRINGAIVLSKLESLQIFLNETPLCEPISVTESDRSVGSVSIDIEWTNEVTELRKVKRSPWNRVILKDNSLGETVVTLDTSINPVEISKTRFYIMIESKSVVGSSTLKLQNFYTDHEVDEYTYTGSIESKNHPYLSDRTLNSQLPAPDIEPTYDVYNLLTKKVPAENCYINGTQKTSYYSSFYEKPLVDLTHCQILYDSNFGMGLLDLSTGKLYYNVPLEIAGSIIGEREDFPLMPENPESYKYYTFYDARIAYDPINYKVWKWENTDTPSYSEFFPGEKFVVPSYFDMVHCFFCVTEGDTKIIDLYNKNIDKKEYWHDEVDYFNNETSDFFTLRNLDLFAGESINTQRKLHANLYISLQLFKKLRVEYPEFNLQMLDCGIQIGTKYFVPYTEYYDSVNSTLRILPEGSQIDNMLIYKTNVDPPRFDIISLIDMVSSKRYPAPPGTSYILSRGNLFRSTATTGVTNVDPRT